MKTKTLKNIISTGIVGAFLGLVSTSFPVKEPYSSPEEKFLKEKNIEYVITDHLTLNMDKTKTIVTITTEEEAIEDMRYLCQKNVNEESWIQIPLENDSRYMFIEIGRDNKTYILNGLIHTQSSIDYDVLNKVVKNIDQYIRWHYHPDVKLMYSEAKKIKKSYPNKIITKTNNSESIDSILYYTNIFFINLSNNTNFNGSLPSSADLNSLKNAYSYEKTNSTTCSNNKIVSSKGVSDFSMTHKGITLAKKRELNDFIGKKYDILSTKNKLKFAGPYFNISYDAHKTQRDTAEDIERELLFMIYANPYITK
ncbi:MAG: hypothetical protein ACP5N1_06875 [Candidatus Woesearchaeota archaeon]